jgi:hypothetical protein
LCIGEFVHDSLKLLCTLCGSTAFTHSTAQPTAEVIDHIGPEHAMLTCTLYCGG